MTKLGENVTCCTTSAAQRSSRMTQSDSKTRSTTRTLKSGTKPAQHGKIGYLNSRNPRSKDIGSLHIPQYLEDVITCPCPWYGFCHNTADIYIYHEKYIYNYKMDNDDIELYSLETCGVSSICTYFVNISAIEMHTLWPWNRGYIAFWLCQETNFFKFTDYKPDWYFLT